MMMLAVIYGIMPSAPMAHCFNAPPVNRLYMPTTEFDILPAFESNHSRNALPSRPGTGTQAMTRHKKRTASVKRIRDFNSGILKQLAKVLKRLANMQSLA